MLTLRQNITSVIESTFAESKEELQEMAVNRIMELIGEPQTDCDKCQHRYDGTAEYCRTCGASNFQPKDEPQTESKYPCKSCKHRKIPKADYPCESCYEGDRYEPQIIKVGMATDSVTGKVLGVTLDTDCAWR